MSSCQARLHSETLSQKENKQQQEYVAFMTPLTNPKWSP
jgi:hypothetical protein